ncbi:MAG: purine-nucleoside phosphorylase [Rhodospirillales bacterium]|nr:purine-nucleoside phosphorylase [Rhodospirillales bacterium]
MTKTDGQIAAASAIIRQRLNGVIPKVGIVLGSGLGSFADSVENPTILSYGDLPGFPDAGVAGHAGRLVFGSVGGTAVAVMQGRAHYYEAANAAAMMVPVRTLKEIGCETLLLTNAAGSTNPDAGPGSVMLLSDHISFTGVSPLFGETGDQRFVDLTDAYDPELRQILSAHAADMGIALHDGIYMWFCGPHFETPAEIRAAAILGATAVGMSTVPEVILARHARMRVAALSIVTNLAAGLGDTELSHEQTMENAKIAAASVQQLIHRFLSDYKAG